MDAAADDDASSSSSSSSSFNGGDPEDSISSSDGAPSSRSSSPDSSSSSSELNHKGPLFEMSPLMAQLPIKRGLSKFYEGKSQSFTCLGDARCVEDLAKEETTPRRKRMKTTWKDCYNLDAIITKRPCFVPGTCSWRRSESNNSSSLLARRRRRRRRSGGGSLFLSSNPPPIPLHRNLL